MAYLLDTHALVWWWLDDPSLSPAATALLTGGEGRVYVSAITGYEIALKVQKGQLDAMAEPLGRFDALVEDDAFHHLPLRHAHAIRAGLLTGRHRDPFDRMIVAQGLEEGLTVVTCDPAFAALGCRTLW